MVISLLTNMTVEVLKTILDEKGKLYSSNVLAAWCSVILSIAVGVIRFFVFSPEPSLIVETVVLAYLSFLSSTVGYDKIIQMLDQMNTVSVFKGNEHKE